VRQAEASLIELEKFPAARSIEWQVSRLRV
jgi:hypothetical protein